MKLRNIIAAIAVAALAPLSAQAAPIQWTVGSGGNDHWYEYIASSGISYDTAFANAAASSFMGMQGYLATITSSGENNFIIGSSVTNGAIAWVGGSDAGAPVNQWTWRNGPESGQAFTFTQWGAGEPNNCCGGEDYLHINWFGAWNDIPSNFNGTHGYVVEFSSNFLVASTPEPATLGLLGVGFALLGLRRKQRI